MHIIIYLIIGIVFSTIGIYIADMDGDDAFFFVLFSLMVWPLIAIIFLPIFLADYLKSLKNEKS